MSDKRLRPRRLYSRPAYRWVGFGRVKDQLDLFESEYRVGWWFVGVCRVCLVDALMRLRGGMAAAVELGEQDDWQRGK